MTHEISSSRTLRPNLYDLVLSKVMHHLKKVTNFCLYMRYTDHKKTLDKYGATKETISIWAPSHTPHIPKIARN